ncbi:hypothetical protein [Cellulomonas sp. P5_C5]
MDPNPLLPTVGDAVATVLFVLVSLLLLAGAAWSVVVAARMITVLRDARRDPLDVDARVLARAGRSAEARLAEAPDLDRRVLVTADASAWLYVVVTGATGLALFAVSAALGAIGWAFVELPGADNNLLREATLALFPVVFVGLSIAGSVTIGRRPVTAPARSMYRTAAVVLSAAGFALAVVGAGRFSAHSTAAQIRPVLDDASWLNTTGSNGIVILLVAVAFSGAGLVALALGRAPAAATS